MNGGGAEANLLQRTYDELDFAGGRLLAATSEPTDVRDWDSIGEWLTLAHRMEADRIFFVGDDPVILFKSLPSSAGEAEIVRAYRSAWSLARPHCLFLATQDTLRVYALNAPPHRSEDGNVRVEPLRVVERASDVAEMLVDYHRERIESGGFFDERPFNSREGRADAQLISDVRAANRALIQAGLPSHIAHALIERVILIRYLEDRSIVTPEYLAQIAGTQPSWHDALNVETSVQYLGARSSFVASLSNREFVFAIFSKLEAEFNGDLFRVEDGEREFVEQHHLDLLRDLLVGSGFSSERPLFLWAYDFGTVPTSLISSMYEQFYRSGTEDDTGTHYTPPELVEFVLGRTLGDGLLDEQPSICDPACGSGIFLVEAYRRIVRHASVARRRALTSDELRELLLQRIAGVDINPAAIRLAAFSLYLAYLNFMEPRDILMAGPLPPLIHRPESADDNAVLVTADAFSPTRDESDGGLAPLPWFSNAYDVVVGNPPWGEPRQDMEQSGDTWARDRGLAVGDRSRSQLFLWRSLDFLKPKGVAALLVAATAFHNARSTSRRFRSDWLQRIKLREYVNFTSSRAYFFDAATAPFALVVFQPNSARLSSSKWTRFPYSSVEPSRSLIATRAVAHARLERRWVDQRSLMQRDHLWKTYAWGNHHDEALMARLDVESTLRELLHHDRKPGFGFQPGTTMPSDELRSLRCLRRFELWGPLEDSIFEAPPTGTKTQPSEHLYRGQRIVIAQGFRSGYGPAARLEDSPFSFRHTIYCLPLQHVPNWQAKIVLGILLSSLGRYRLFMSSGSWGVWHDTIHASNILALPIRMPAEANSHIADAVVRAVDDLRVCTGTGRIDGLLKGDNPSAATSFDEIQGRLNHAVYELFDLGPAEADLVDDFVRYTLPLAGRKSRWLDQPRIELPKPNHGTASDLNAAERSRDIRDYIAVFLECWNRELQPTGELSWRVHRARHAPLAAIVFELQERGAAVGNNVGVEDVLWRSVLERLHQSLEVPATMSIRMNGSLHSVSHDSIVIAKRTDARLWTATTARADAEATMLQATNLRSTQ